MKIMKVILFAAVAALTACSDNEPETVLDIPDKVASITSAEDSQQFTYDLDGRIKEWSSKDPDKREEYKSRYEYPAADAVRIIANETVPNPFFEDRYNDRAYEENLHLSADGTVEYAEGLYTYTEYPDVVMKKKYRCDFLYDVSRHLTCIKISEWMMTDGQPDNNVWSYEHTLEWKDGDLLRYNQSTGGSKPYWIHEYRYYGNFTTRHTPLVFPVFRSFYIPLQLAGYFGKQSEHLVDRRYITSSIGETSQTVYSYTFGTTVFDTWVEGYSMKFDDNPETEYKVSWTN